MVWKAELKIGNIPKCRKPDSFLSLKSQLLTILPDGILENIIHKYI